MSLCPNCGSDPCYHICFNSPHYYSPEQERHDDAMDNARYDDVRERFSGFDGELEREMDYADEHEHDSQDCTRWSCEECEDDSDAWDERADGPSTLSHACDDDDSYIPF